MSLPTTKVDVAAVWKAKLYLQNNDGNFGIRGTTHTHCVGVYKDLPGSSTALGDTTPPDVSRLVKAYQGIIGKGTQVLWVSLTVSRVSPGVTIAALAAPANPLAHTTESPVADTNLSGDVAVFRLQTAAGQKAYRFADFVRDTDIADATFQIDVSGFTPGAGNLQADLTTATAVQAWKNWMQVLLDDTCLASYKGGKWSVQPFNSIILRGCRSRAVGQGFYSNRHHHLT